MKYKQKQKQLRADEERKFQQMMEAKQMDLNIQRATFFAKEEAKTISIDKDKEWDMRIAQMVTAMKSESQAMMKEIIKNNRIEQDINKNELEKEKAA